MIRIALLFLFVFIFTGIPAQNVFYGERKLNGTDLHIYLDKDGFPYPDYPVSDSSMTKAYGSLFTWFQQNNEAFISLSATYQLFPEVINQKTIFQLRDSISAGIVRRINRESQSFPAVAFYIHGFRKAFVPMNSDVTSVDEFLLLEKSLASYSKPVPFEVEVYWDGMYDCCFSANKKRNNELFQLYETAGKNARSAGISLRKIISGVNNAHIQIIAHSLGARVACSALFDEKPGEIAVPSQEDIAICLIAPAIDGKSTFSHYYNRTSATDFKTSDNYRLLVIYNESDFVLQKRDPKTGVFGPGPTKFGATTLGCNWKNEAVHLQEYFTSHYPNSTIELVDKTALGKCHSLRCYTNETDLKEVSDFIWRR